MPQYTFSLSSVDRMREAGVVQSESFSDALEAIDDNCILSEGDTLEIGVDGFPPARFERIRLPDEQLGWRPRGLLAA